MKIRHIISLTALSTMAAAAALAAPPMPLQPSPRGGTVNARLSPTRHQPLRAEQQTPPWVCTFDDAESLNDFTIDDANGDGITWTWENDTQQGDGAAKIQYNTKMAMDDWLISPPVYLKAGCVYKVSVSARSADSTWKEHLEVKFGSTPSGEGMTEPIVPKTELNHITYKEYSGEISVDTPGEYYIGLHGCSKMNRLYLWLDNLKVSAPREVPVPDGVTNLSVEPDAGGALRTDISFTTPTMTRTGATLTDLTAVNVYRNGENIKTFSSPGTGVSLSMTDEVDKYGFYDYRIEPVNDAGTGKVTDVRVFVGIGKPMEPRDVNATEDPERPGMITLTWTAPTTDTDRNPLNQDLVSYTITEYTNGHPKEIVSGLKNVTSYTYRACEATDPQSFKNFSVAAVTAGGSLEGFSPTLAVGAPYVAPYVESVPDGHAHTILCNADNGATWTTGTRDTFEGKTVDGSDADNGYLRMYGYYIDVYSTLITGKIDLSALTEPYLVFDMYHVVGTDPDTNELQIAVNDGSSTINMPTIVVNADCTEKDAWNRIELPMADWKGKTVQLAFTGVLKSQRNILIDNINIRDLTDNNVAINYISAPENALPDTEENITVGLVNNGRNKADGVIVTLERNGRAIASQEIPAIEAGKSARAEFPVSFNAASPAESKFVARLDWSADEDAADNVSDEAVTYMYMTPLPGVTRLTGEASGAGATLAWSEPDYHGDLRFETRDNFEDARSWATEGVGEWTFVDTDGLNIGGFVGDDMVDLPFPGIYSDQPYSYWVMDASEPILDSSFAAHSGNKYLAQMYVLAAGSMFTKGQCDDWLISPEVDGSESRTISFYARSYDPALPESMEVLYSMSNKSISSFDLAARIERVSGIWTRYEANLPVGTKYFALRCTSADGMALFIDDISYMPAKPVRLTLKGYNVYCDGQRLTSAPVADTGINLEALGAGLHTLGVSAVYDKGESRAALIDLTTASVGCIPTDSEARVIGMYNLQGQPVVNPASGTVIIERLSDGTARKVRR